MSAPAYIIHQGDCLEAMRGMADASIDAIVCDPPYGLSREPDMLEVLRHWLAGDDYQHRGAGFMGKAWDSFVPGPAVWREALRVLKPGGHLLSFFGTRTYDMGVLAIRIAGFEIRDQIDWVYGSGFPKSLDVSKAIDGHVTNGRSDSVALRGVNQTRPGEATLRPTSTNGHRGIVGSSDAGPSVKRNEPATEAARQWSGWGTALKPAHEPIVVARKPLIGTVAANVLMHGTGALNIDGCRIQTDEELRVGAGATFDAMHRHEGRLGELSADRTYADVGGTNFAMKPGPRGGSADGRWPANLIHDGSDEVTALFPETTSGAMKAGTQRAAQDGPGSVVYGTYGGDTTSQEIQASSGSAARFFYCAKASRADRNEGCDDLPQKVGGMVSNTSGQHMTRRDEAYEAKPLGNFHPTVKPTALMAYLVRLVTPPGGTVLDPFAGSGSTGKACMREGFNFIGCEMDRDENGAPLGYIPIALARIEFERQRVYPPPAKGEQFDIFGTAA